MAKSHPYNPLWAQLGDLYGAVGNPLRLCRTVITGKKRDLIKRLLVVLSYFVRCSDVIECAMDMRLPSEAFATEDVMLSDSISVEEPRCFRSRAWSESCTLRTAVGGNHSKTRHWSGDNRCDSKTGIGTSSSLDDTCRTAMSVHNKAISGKFKPKDEARLAKTTSTKCRVNVNRTLPITMTETELLQRLEASAEISCSCDTIEPALRGFETSDSDATITGLCRDSDDTTVSSSATPQRRSLLLFRRLPSTDHGICDYGNDIEQKSDVKNLLHNNQELSSVAGTVDNKFSRYHHCSMTENVNGSMLQNVKEISNLVLSINSMTNELTSENNDKLLKNATKLVESNVAVGDQIKESVCKESSPVREGPKIVRVRMVGREAVQKEWPEPKVMVDELSPRNEIIFNKGLPNESIINKEMPNETVDRNSPIRSVEDHKLSVKAEIDHNSLVKPVIDHNSLVKPVIDHNSLVKPVIDHNSLVKPVIDHNSLVKPVIDHNSLVKPVIDHNSLVKPVIDHNSLVKPVIDHNSLVKPVIDHNSLVKPVIDHNSLVKPVIDHNSLVKPAVDPVKPVFDHNLSVKSNTDCNLIVKDSFSKETSESVVFDHKSLTSHETTIHPNCQNHENANDLVFHKNRDMKCTSSNCQDGNKLSAAKFSLQRGNSMFDEYMQDDSLDIYLTNSSNCDNNNGVSVCKGDVMPVSKGNIALVSNGNVLPFCEDKLTDNQKETCLLECDYALKSIRLEDKEDSRSGQAQLNLVEGNGSESGYFSNQPW